MKFLRLFLLFLCVAEIYGQRSRTTANQETNKEEPKPVRTRGRTRFSTTEEAANLEQPTRTTTNRRASSRTRIHSNNPKAATDRRARPTEASRGYAVEEINNDSPIETFRRQSKSRVLTENRFEIPSVTVEELGFGSTARAILQSRGETLPPKTTTPVVDEEYLLTNFGSTIRSLAAASRSAQASFSRTANRNDAVQRPTPLRSEVSILDKSETPSQRSSLRGDPLLSLRGSNIVNREPTSRSRNGAKSRLADARVNARLESERRSMAEESVVEDFVRLDPETEGPEVIQGLPEQSELVTDTQPLEIVTEIVFPDEDESIRTSSVEVSTSKGTYSLPPKRIANNNRRNGFRVKNVDTLEVTPASKNRAIRTRPTRRPDDLNSETSASSRTKVSRRKFDDAVVAESRHRGPSVFTAEQFQDVTTRSRTGRRIDAKYENVPGKPNVEYVFAATPRVRSSGRRATTAGSTTSERSTSIRDKNVRGRSRSRSDLHSQTTKRSSSRRTSHEEGLNNRRASLAEDKEYNSRKANVDNSIFSVRRSDNLQETTFYGEKSNVKENVIKNEIIPPRSNSKNVDTPSRRRGGSSRFQITDSVINDTSFLKGRKQKTNKVDIPQTRNKHSNKNTARQPETVEETTLYYGEKSRRTDPPDTTIPPTTTTTRDKPVVKARSRSRFAETPPKIDETKLEVLPLFEREPKAVTSSRSRGQRSRSSISRRHGEDHMQFSATENDVKFVEKPTTSAFTRVTVTRTESVEASTSRVRVNTRTASPITTETPRRSSSSSSSSTTVPTTRATTTTLPTVTTTQIPETTTTTKKWVTRASPVIRESVVAEINQVTSKSTITRRKKVPKAKAAEMLSRGTKKADVKLADVIKKKNSVEEIDEEDNYPEPFKALIQAKKMQEDTETPQSSPRSVIVAPTAKSTTTPRAIVTSASTPTSSSTARVVTTTTVAPRKPQKINEIVNDNENELDPLPRITPTTPITTKPTGSRHLPKFSEKPKYHQRQKEKFSRSTEKPKFSVDKYTTKTTSIPRKYYSTKSYSTRASLDHHSRRKALRSTAFPPSTTPLTSINLESKFSAKFIKKENKTQGSETTTFKFNGSQQPKGLYSSRKSVSRESGEVEEKKAKQLDISLIQNAKPMQPIKKINSSRYSSKYRSDISTRSSVLKSTTSAPFYIPTIPTPAYVPTIPTISPPVTPVDGIVAVKDGDLGLEVISFDDPVNTIPSADLVNGEYLTTDKNLKLLPTVKDGTTEKPVSIIERIINSITMISTTAAPNTTTFNPSSPSTTEAMENSAILKLAIKKTTTKDKTKPDVQTNIIETITSEKPTTIIEKIRSSLSAIQTNEVGTSDFNTVSSSSTTPLSTVTKYSAKYRGSSVGTTALSAPQPLSTSINPLSVFDEIEDQVLEKRTIGKLLNILNGLVSTQSPDAEKLVVVTPKNVLSTSGFTASTFSSQEPLEVTNLNGIEARASFYDPSSSSSFIFDSPSTANTESTSTTTVNTESSPVSTVNNDSATDVSMAVTTEISAVTTTTSEGTETTTSFSTIPSEIIVSTSSTRYTQTPTSVLPSITNDIPFTTSPPLSTTTVDDAMSSTLFTFPSTFPSVPTFEVSPESVSIFSANDLFNSITPEDNLLNTVTIASRIGIDNNTLTSTDSATSTTQEPTTTTESATVATTTDIDMSTMPSITTTDSTSTMVTSTLVDTTTMLSTTVSEEITTFLTTTTTMSSNTSNTNVTNAPPLSNRSGRILTSDIGEPIGNSIDISTPSTTTSTTPDYFIFAVLNNNTILRKRPPTIPNKETPFVIVGLFPNNTVVRKFPNGTLVPMDPVIKVRGFDIRPNPPPLVEITSNQVTDTINGMTTLDNNSATVESNRMARILATEQSNTESLPRVVITSTTASVPVSTTSVSNTIPSTTNGPTTSSTTLPPTTTTFSSTATISTSTQLPSTNTLQTFGTTLSPKVLEIMAVPGETRISKSQTTTESNAQSTSFGPITSEASTIPQSTETIPPTLGEILNGRTVDALNSLIKSEAPSTKASNFKTLQVNQNSINSSTTIDPSTSSTSQQTNENVTTFTPILSTLPTNSDMNAMIITTTDLSTTTLQFSDNAAPFTSVLYTEPASQTLSSRNSINNDSSTVTIAQSLENEAPFTSSILITEKAAPVPSSSDRLLSSTLISTLMPMSTTTAAPITQSTTATTRAIMTSMRTNNPETRLVETTTRRLTTSAVPKITTGFPAFAPSTIFPSILTTLFPSFIRDAINLPDSPISSTRRPLNNAELTNSIGDRFEVLSASASTARPTTVLPQTSTSQRISTTISTPTTTTNRQTTTQTTTRPTTTTPTTRKPTTTRISSTTTTVKTIPTSTAPKVSLSGTPMPSTKEETDKLFEELKKNGKLKNLNEEQRRNLEEIEKIEKEQAELLKQLSVLTTMFGNQNVKVPNLPPLPNPITGTSPSLANRIIAMAMERDKSRTTTDVSLTTYIPTTTRKPHRVPTKRPNSIQDQLPITKLEDATKKTTPSLEDVLKQYNLNGLSTPAPLTSTYGKTDEALLAAILKEQGIGPTTPKILGDRVKEAGIFEEVPTSRKPKPRSRTITTTARPIGGRLMQGLNWLLDILDPPTTKKPAARKAKPKPQTTKQQNSADEELLTNLPTRITPMITAAPVTKPNLSQHEIQVLIKQLEAVQDNPNAAGQLDFSKIKSLQNLINVNEGVQVTHTGQHGATSRATPRPSKVRTTTAKDVFLTEMKRKPKASTVSTLSVSNSIDDDDVEVISTTGRNRFMPPVSLNPILGIDDTVQGDSMIRGNLLTAAVNVTRAISSFLGSAIQDAAQQVRTMFYTGSSGAFSNLSSASNVPSIAGASSG